MLTIIALYYMFYGTTTTATATSDGLTLRVGFARLSVLFVREFMRITKVIAVKSQISEVTLFPKLPHFTLWVGIHNCTVLVVVELSWHYVGGTVNGSYHHVPQV